MKIKFLTAMTAAVLCAGGFFTLNSNAAETNAAPQFAFGHGFLLERIKEKLELTDDQAAQIKTVLKSENDTLTGLLTALHGARADLRTAIRAGDASETSVRTASAKVAAAEADMAVERMKLFHAINPILTDDQRAKVVQFESQVDGFVDNLIDQIHERLAE